MWIFFSDFTGSQVGESLLGHSTLAGASVRGEQSAGPRTLQGQIQWSLSENRIKRVTPNLLVNKLQCPVGGYTKPFQTDPDIVEYCPVLPETRQGHRCSANCEKDLELIRGSGTDLRWKPK